MAARISTPPIHFAEGRLTADQLPVGQLIGPGIVIDVTKQASEDVDYLVKPSDMETHERAHGRIPEGALRVGCGERLNCAALANQY